MQAVILGAGLGTRLRPVTNTVPKVLLPVFDQPLLEFTLRYLKKNGVSRLAMNTHHLADQVQNYVSTSSLCRELSAAINHEPEILGTGGGLKGLEKFITDDDFVVYNSDIVTNIDLAPAIAFHKEKKAVVTLLLHDCPQFNKITLDREQAVTAIIDGPSQPVGQEKRWAFTGITVVNRCIFPQLALAGFQDIKDVWLRMIAQHNGAVSGYICRGHYWLDIGSAASYWQLHRDVLVDKKNILTGFFPPAGMQYRGAGARVSSSVLLRGFGTVGAGAILEAGEYENCVVLPGTMRNTVGAVRNGIIGNGYVCPHPGPLPPGEGELFTTE